jgi:hypothetical protein
MQLDRTSLRHPLPTLPQSWGRALRRVSVSLLVFGRGLASSFKTLPGPLPTRGAFANPTLLLEGEYYGADHHHC